MKKLILAAMIACTAVPAYAASDDTCKTMSRLAEAIMKSRQARVPLSKMLDLVSNAEGMSASGKEAVRPLVILAYKSPAFEIAENQDKAVADFVNSAEVSCYSAK